LAHGYDWLYNRLTEDEKNKVLDALIIRTKLTAEEAMTDKKIRRDSNKSDKKKNKHM